MLAKCRTLRVPLLFCRLDEGGLLAWERRDDIVAAASSCPMPDCSSLVIEYRAAVSIRPGPAIPKIGNSRALVVEWVHGYSR